MIIINDYLFKVITYNFLFIYYFIHFMHFKAKFKSLVVSYSNNNQHIFFILCMDFFDIQIYMLILLPLKHLQPIK